MSKPKLISFKVCPYVQRSVILLNEKGVDYDVEFIDVYDPPDWFLILSPTGKVPVLLVDDEVIFESVVISEYLDEVYPPALHPEDPVQKAKNRAWIEYTSPLYTDLFKLQMASNKEDAEAAQNDIRAKLDGLSSAKHNSPWFNGENLSLIDIAAAPFFVRVAFYKKYCDIDLLGGYSVLQQWSADLLVRQSVITSTVDDFDALLIERMQSNGSYIYP